MSKHVPVLDPRTAGGAGPAGRPSTRPLRDPSGLSEPMRVRRAVTLLLLTVVVPGTAQLVAGNRAVGRLALRIWLGVVAVGVALLGLSLVARGFVVGLLTRPVLLSLVAICLFALAVALPALVVDAWRLGRPRLLPVVARRWVAGLTALLVVATCAVPLLAGRRAWAAGDLIGSVFSSGRSSDAVDGRYTVLLLGGDAGTDRIGLRPDSITLASIDEDTGRTVLFSLPRNLENVPFPAGTPAAKALPDGWSCGDECLLNALYTWGSEHPEYFPDVDDPGLEAMKQAVSASLGLTVNYSVVVDLNGFRKIIDAMGGIDVTVLERVPIGGGTSKIKGWIEPGEQHLDGYHALWFARSREGASDYARMARQRCVMTAMAAQLDPATLLARFQDIAAAGKQVVKTDLPASELGEFLDLGLKAKSQKISSVQFVPPLIKPARPDYTVIQEKVRTAIAAAERKDEDAPAAASTGAAAPPAGQSGSSSGSSSGGTTGAGSGAAEADDAAQVCAAG